MDVLPPEIVGVWLHSHEEDTDSTMVYRPRGYVFPPSRGRDAIDLRSDGTLIEYGSGPDDRGQAVVGRWVDLGHGRLRITIPRGEGIPPTRRVLSWAPDVLAIER